VEEIIGLTPSVFACGKSSNLNDGAMLGFSLRRGSAEGDGEV